MFCFVKPTSKISQTLYFRFSTILGHYFRILLLLINEGKKTSFYVSSSYISTMLKFTDTMSTKWNKYPAFYVSLLLGNILFNNNEVTRNISVNYVRNFVISQMFWLTKQIRKNYSRHYVEAFSIFWVVTSIDSYESMKDKYLILYVSLSCIYTTLQFTDTN